jgi:threonine synthase
MGLPVKHLIIATNENDILARTLATGIHRIGQVKSTITPAMDIQLPSNFERALFEVSGRDAPLVTTLMRQLSEGGSYTLPTRLRTDLAAIFQAGQADRRETIAEMVRLHRASGYECDPHTAVASHVADEYHDSTVPMIALGTAHPAKFADTVLNAIGTQPRPPAWAAIPDDRVETVSHLDGDQARIETFILSKISH